MKKIIPITPNRGGLVPIPDIIGREKEIEEMWKILEKQGIALFAERRFGKSSILRKMEAEVIDGFVVIVKHIEGTSSVEDFATELIDRAKEKKLIDEKFTEKIKNLYNATTEVVDEIKGFKLKKITAIWQQQIIKLLDKLIIKNPNKRIIIMLDEFSIFIDKLKKEEAISVLGFLRDIAHTERYEKIIRFVYNGSIGIDLVLDKLKIDKTNIGDPINHLYKYKLNVFSDENALYFGNCLKEGCGIDIKNYQIEAISRRSDNIPYYIDIVFDKLSNKKKVTDKDMDDVFDQILDDTSSKESTQHFFSRIDKFYPLPKLSIHILNYISKNKKYSDEKNIFNNVLSLVENMDRLDVNKEIERLKNDGYLIRKVIKGKRFYDFKYSLLKEWWCRNKAF